MKIRERYTIPERPPAPPPQKPHQPMPMVSAAHVEHVRKWAAGTVERSAAGKLGEDDPHGVWASIVLDVIDRLDARERRIATLEARLARVLRLVRGTGLRMWTGRVGTVVSTCRVPMLPRTGVWSGSRRRATKGGG